jgi:hypothetical protein
LLSLLDALSQLPVNKFAINSKVAAVGVAHADGLQLTQTQPPPCSEKNLCGPGASHLEQSVNDGAYPATESERSKYASRINEASYLRSANTLSEPVTNKYC